MCPFTPHLAEELWHSLGKKTYASLERYPTVHPEAFSEKEEVGEYLLSKVVDDSNEIFKVTNIKPKKVYLYVSPVWKQQLYQKAFKLYDENKLDVGTLMKTAMADPAYRMLGKQVSQFVGGLVSDIKKMTDNDKGRYRIAFNEKEYLESARIFLEKTFSAEVQVFRADDEKKIDPANKSRFAVPLRPAIYIE